MYYNSLQFKTNVNKLHYQFDNNHMYYILNVLFIKLLNFIHAAHIYIYSISFTQYPRKGMVFQDFKFFYILKVGNVFYTLLLDLMH